MYLSLNWNLEDWVGIPAQEDWVGIPAQTLDPFRRFNFKSMSSKFGVPIEFIAALLLVDYMTAKHGIYA